MRCTRTGRGTRKKALVVIGCFAWLAPSISLELKLSRFAMIEISLNVFILSTRNAIFLLRDLLEAKKNPLKAGFEVFVGLQEAC